MPDSKPQLSGPGFLKTFSAMAKNVGKRVCADGKKVLFSQESEDAGDVRALTTIAVVGLGVIYAPAAFAIVGGLAVASAALDPLEEEGGVEAEAVSNDDLDADTAEAQVVG